MAGSTPAATPPAPPAKKQRSPSTLRRLIELAEREMTAATGERDRVLGELSAAGHDHVALGAIAGRLAEAETRLAGVEERWLTLSEELGA